MWLSSVYGPHAPLYTPDNVWACYWWDSGLCFWGWEISCQTWIRPSVSSWTALGATWQWRMHRYMTVWSETCTRGGGHFVGLWQCSSCSSLHKGADTGPAAGLLLFHGPVQLASHTSLSPGISPTHSWDCPGRHSKPSCDTYGCAILEELDYLCNLNGLQVPPHATSSDKGTSKMQN